MNAHRSRTTALVAFCLLALGILYGRSSADESDLQSVLLKAKNIALEDSHLLQYKFTEGELLRWKVRQLGTTEATVRGNTQTSQMRAVSTKQWKITDVDSEGNFEFVHSVLDVDMWQKVSDRQEVRYNSAKDKTAPPEYTQVAKTVGVPIATVKITSSGQILERDKAPLQYSSGLGEIAVPLPVGPVKVGQDWHMSNEIRVRRQDGQQMRVKTRLVYTLRSVKTGVATIAIRTEVITPVNDPQIESQLVQQLVNGELKFDVDAGRIISRQIDWDETVVGFSGDDSVMKYVARFTEELMPVEKIATKDGDATR